jgi:hypothetical protein
MSSTEEYAEKPSIKYCQTGILPPGEKYNQSIHLHGRTPYERCEPFYSTKTLYSGLYKGGIKKRRTINNKRRKQKRTALTRTRRRRYNRSRR